MPAFGGLPFAEKVWGRYTLIRGDVMINVKIKYPVSDNPFVEINMNF